MTGPRVPRSTPRSAASRAFIFTSTSGRASASGASYYASTAYLPAWAQPLQGGYDFAAYAHQPYAPPLPLAQENRHELVEGT